ncbi:Globin-like protein [Aphelenchoides bicaudatus]|nr:Globin-like protein [Aphelenchoides bicaudatus]
MCGDTEADIQYELIRSLRSLPIDNSQHGVDFYKFMFTHYPHLRMFFRDAERFTAQQVQESERFKQQGQRLMLAMHFLALSFDRPDVIKAYARDLVLKHRRFKMDPSLWQTFFQIWCSFLASKNLVDINTRKAWQAVGNIFSKECVKYTKFIGP